jgi:hypothetical protein
VAGDLAQNVGAENTLIFDPCDTGTLPYDVFYEIDMEQDYDKKLELLRECCRFCVNPKI